MFDIGTVGFVLQNFQKEIIKCGTPRPGVVMEISTCMDTSLEFTKCTH